MFDLEANTRAFDAAKQSQHLSFSPARRAENPSYTLRAGTIGGALKTALSATSGGAGVPPREASNGLQRLANWVPPALRAKIALADEPSANVSGKLDFFCYNASIADVCKTKEHLLVVCQQRERKVDRLLQIESRWRRY